ncbi:transcriptional regulator, AraC family [Clostridium cavendishii DSM 21758]|uniref:Transcriptional regulator, AraC family n=1 Tax=Clostridium cavendishii DSM 21758 TaxID=1121302 RepID=A0A1M6MIK7_9CLOT|nr:AraC family transcriptional regulator [Clostridium cavendishii]SHJ83302.1 transcriptional regulator, AraC family [Clostridium cavendishii DSM 21758]
MDWIETIRKALNFIEDEISNSKLSIELIAQHVYVSESHFARAFNILTGFTLSEYIRNRRLSISGELLNKTDLSIIDVAFKVGYESPEAFSKAFKRFHGVNPSEGRNAKLKEFYPLHVTLILTQERPLTWTIEDKKAIFLSGTTTVVNYENSYETEYIWPQSEADGYIDKCFNFAGFKALVGVSVDKGYTIKAMCDKKSPETTCIIPPNKWVIFPCHGDIPEHISRVWSQIYTNWMPTNDYKLNDYPMLEVYFENEDGYDDCEIWISIENKY